MSPDQFQIWNTFTAGPVQKIDHAWGQIQLSIKRLDLIQSWASGNKYYKLKYNLEFVLDNGIKTIVSKGGMFSNHLDALVNACFDFGIKCVVVIRSYKEDEHNPSILRWKQKNAHLVFLDPATYAAYNEVESRLDYPDSFFIPEGGSNEKGISGTSEIIDDKDESQFDHIILAGGTMSTVAGILSKVSKGKNVIIVPAWKGCTVRYIEELLFRNKIEPICKWEIWPDYHFGGFGKYNKSLADFMYSFTGELEILLEPVYTGKMMYAVRDKMQSGYFGKDDSILALHTGGLQGIDGFAYRDAVTWRKYATFIV